MSSNLTYGASATIAVLATSGAPSTSQAVPVQNASFVWNFWDSDITANNFGVARWPINRPTLNFTVSVFDIYGRFLTKQSSQINADIPPAVVTPEIGIFQNSIPYFVQLQVATNSPSTPVFIWTDANGNILAQSNPTINVNSFSFTYLVNQVDSQIILIVQENGNEASSISINFTLPGNQVQAPYTSPLTSGLVPFSWYNILNSVNLATNQPLILLAGQPVVDGVTVSPKWVKINNTFSLISASRILVKNQASTVDNGIYRAETTSLSYLYRLVSGFNNGQVNFQNNVIYVSQYDATGANAIPVLLDHATLGRYIFFWQDSSNYIQFLILGVSQQASGIQLSVTQVNQAGTVTPGNQIILNFDWLRSSDQISVGSTLEVIDGNTNSGEYFSAVFDPSPDSYVPGTTPVIFPMASAPYNGSASSNARLWIENSISDPQGLSCLSTLNYLTLNTQQSIPPVENAVVRAKAITAGMAIGQYQILEQVSNVSNVSGFQAATSVQRATVIVNAS